jgi:uncharacterized protein (DUF1684 family)
VKNLTKEHGWLSLVSLDWIKGREHRISSVGKISLRADSVFLTLDKGIQATLNGIVFRSGPVQPDKDKIFFGTKALSVVKRNSKYAVRIWDSEHPSRKSFTAIERYPVDEQWRIEARWEQYAVQKKIEIPTVISGLVEEGIVPGAAIFTINGKEYRLEPTIEEGTEEYFFVFGDRTNGKETYGGGRFLYAKPPKQGKIVLDFNRSYNPPCVFTSFATCPTPVPGNRLSVRIEAGEKNYHHHK